MTLKEFIWVELRRTKPDDLEAAGKIAYSILQRALKNRWRVACRDRGMGHGDWGVTVRLGGSDVLVVGDLPYREMADHICDTHNAYRR